MSCLYSMCSLKSPGLIADCWFWTETRMKKDICPKPIAWLLFQVPLTFIPCASLIIPSTLVLFLLLHIFFPSVTGLPYLSTSEIRKKNKPKKPQGDQPDMLQSDEGFKEGRKSRNAGPETRRHMVFTGQSEHLFWGNLLEGLWVGRKEMWTKFLVIKADNMKIKVRS